MTRTHTRRELLRSLAAAGTLALATSTAGCGGSGNGTDGNGGGATVDMTDDLTFEPASITVGVGETVVWENVGSVGHTVTAYGDGVPADAAYFASGGFGSEQAARDGYPDGDVPGGESYEHTFEVPGTYEYFCIPHESAGMTGTVEVTG